MSSSGLSTTKSLGPHGHWGFSAALDIVAALKCFDAPACPTDQINILLVNPGDIRHILCTASRLRRHFRSAINRPKIRFYLLESTVEIVARDLMLLELLFDIEVPIRQRSNIFLEVFGNLFVQKRTSSYMETLAQRVLTLISRRIGTMRDTVNFEYLSFKQIDELESSLRVYDKKHRFELANYLDHRKRGLYEERFDSRQAIFDWDYHSTLKRKCSIIHIKQYKHWRETGIGFEFGDQHYTEPNKSVMGYAEGIMKAGTQKGTKKEVQGYWGDIVVSPYLSFGIDSETPNSFAQGLYEIYNKNTGTEQHRHHAVEISLYNLFSYLWEIETGQVYKMTKPHDIYSGLGSEGSIKFRSLGEDITNLDNEVEKMQCANNAGDPIVIAEDEGESNSDACVPNLIKDEPILNEEEELVRLLHSCSSIVEVLSSIEICPLVGPPSILQRSKWKGHFNAIFLSCRFAQIASEDFLPHLFNCSTKGLLMMETGKFLVPLSETIKTDVLKKEIELATNGGFVPLDVNPVFRRHRDEEDKEDDVLFFKIN